MVSRSVKLARRLTLFMVAGIVLVLACYALLAVGRERELFQHDSLHEHEVLGLALGTTFDRVWQVDGKQRALELLNRVSAREGRLTARFLWRDQAAHLKSSLARSGADGLVHVELPYGRSSLLLTYVPTHVDARPSVIELRESMRRRDQYLEASLLRAGITTLGIALMCSGLATVLGVRLVGRPVQALVEQTRRIGRGDLEARVALPGHDELRALAEEMNAMAGRLAQARALIESETNARIRALDQLRHADRLATVGKLASGLAHELGTPLNVVAGRAQLIERTPGISDNVGRDARSIREQADRMAQIIRQLLDFARAGDSRKVRTDVAQLTARSVGLLTSVAEKYRVELRLEPSRAVPELDLDPGQIQQVLTNVIVNAIQASPAGGTVDVEIGRELFEKRSDEAPKEYLAIRVSDQGPGMSPAVLERVFEPFFTTKGVGEGTGLGLSVAHGIVEEHGGMIRAESEPGRGSRFTVYLPLPEAS
jgi:two-component system NtrC family sensor kinase